MVQVSEVMKTETCMETFSNPSTEITDLGFTLGLMKTHQSSLKHQRALWVSTHIKTVLGLLITEHAHQETYSNIFIRLRFHVGPLTALLMTSTYPPVTKPTTSALM